MTDSIDIMVIAPSDHGEAAPVTDELVAFGRGLQALGAGTMGVWTVGEDPGPVAREMAVRYGLPVTALQVDGFSHYVSEPYGMDLSEEICAVRPRFVCAAHTSQGWEWAPGAAARVGAACICGVDGLTFREGRICFQKELYGGKVKGLFSPNTATTLITVQPGIFSGKLLPAPGPGAALSATAGGSGTTGRWGSAAPLFPRPFTLPAASPGPLSM